MSGFKDMVARDNFGVFLNCDEFAEKRKREAHLKNKCPIRKK